MLKTDRREVKRLRTRYGHEGSGSVHTRQASDAEVRRLIDSAPSSPSAGPYGYIVLSIDSNLGTGIQNFFARLEKGKALFDDKFVRFAYRYKYKDGE